MAGPGPVLMELREACSESSSHQTVLSPTIAPGRQNTLEQASHSPLRASLRHLPGSISQFLSNLGQEPQDL